MHGAPYDLPYSALARVALESDDKIRLPRELVRSIYGRLRRKIIRDKLSPEECGDSLQIWRDAEALKKELEEPK